MSAARLREAAKALRERAEDATPGPWFLDKGGAAGVYTAPDPTPTSVDIAWSHDLGVEAYIAMMHPGVALALADWLGVQARRAEEVADSLPFGSSSLPAILEVSVTGWAEALRVAEAILGGDER